MRQGRRARGYTWALGLAAGIFAALQAFVAGVAAGATQPVVLALQRSLVGIARGSGVSIDVFGGPILRMLLVFYGTALLSLLITLWFCWYAGGVAVELGGERRSAASAGSGVALWSGLTWVVATLVAVLLFHADGSLSWLVATIVGVVATPQSRAISGINVTNPSALFIGVQVGVLLAQQLVGVLVGLGLGIAAGRMGAGRARRAGKQKTVAVPPRMAPLLPATLPSYQWPAPGHPTGYPPQPYPPQPYPPQPAIPPVMPPGYAPPRYFPPGWAPPDAGSPAQTSEPEGRQQPPS